MPSLYEDELQHTEELQDIITAPPSWILRWGIGIYFAMLLIVISLSAVLKYPDVIKTQLSIRTNNPMVTMSSDIQGQLSKILVRNNQSVKKGDLLGYYNVPFNYQEINTLLEALRQARTKLIRDGEFAIDSLNNSKIIALGELEDTYQNFYLSFIAYKASLSIKTVNYQYEQVREKLVFVHSLENLIHELTEVKDKYFLQSPISGKVSFNSFLEKSQQVNRGEELFTIEPLSAQFFGMITISQNNIGKVRNNQRVLIKLRSYPYEEFGILEGKIRTVGNMISKAGVYPAEVEIDMSKSASEKGIKLKNGMIADAEVITEDVSAFKRITRSLIKLLK